jgi:hypothetical protein
MGISAGFGTKVIAPARLNDPFAEQHPRRILKVFEPGQLIAMVTLLTTAAG